MMNLPKHWLAAILVFYWCLMSPLAFACEAVLKLGAVQGFVERGVLGSKNTYTQRVYSGELMSYSTLIFSAGRAFDKKSLMRQTAKSMISTVLATNKDYKPQVQMLDKKQFPEIDNRLAFLSFITYGIKGSINVEASASIRIKSCWSILRFSALQKRTRNEALNHFANLIRATQFID